MPLLDHPLFELFFSSVVVKNNMVVFRLVVLEEIGSSNALDGLLLEVIVVSLHEEAEPGLAIAELFLDILGCELGVLVDVLGSFWLLKDLD